MKILAGLCCALGMYFLANSSGTKPSPGILIVGGNLGGYLSPCGCTKPMTGGILRRTTLIRQLSQSAPSTIIETGALISSSGRQDQLKVEAIGEIDAKLNLAAISIGKAEAKLGIGGLISLQNIAGPRFVQSEFAAGNRLGIEPLIFHRGFVIGALSDSPRLVPSMLGESGRSVSEAVEDLRSSAKDAEALSVLIFDGPLSSAKLIPGIENISIVIYTSNGQALSEPVIVGNCKMYSPGEKGKYVLSIEVDGEKVVRAKAHELPASIQEDSAAKGVFNRYLSRVRSENLIAKVPRSNSDAFAGNQKCSSCHAKEAKVWSNSEHAKALQTLVKTKQDVDPDCVSCHVVGLDSKKGFQSLKSTPQFANVGCESCHGAGAKHASSPLSAKMPKVGKKACAPCHVPNHSPGFSFEKYWPKVQH